MKTSEIRKLLEDFGMDASEHLEDARLYLKKPAKKYGLFEKVDNRWVRLIPGLEGSKKAMISACQDALLAYSFGYCQNERQLRPLN